MAVFLHTRRLLPQQRVFVRLLSASTYTLFSINITAIQDFGVWNVSYESVSCADDWAGAKNPSALGSVDDGSSVCCPADPTVGDEDRLMSMRPDLAFDLQNPADTCPSFSDHNAIP